jgi:hypothetical protein
LKGEKKMKKSLLIPFVCALAIPLLMAGCGGKYADAKKVNNEYIELMQRYIDDLDKTENAKQAADAIRRFADGMEKLWPRMRELSEKYPELKDTNNPPEELMETQAKAQEMGKKMAGAMMKIMPYLSDPEVREAQKRLQEAMKKK